MLNQLIQNVWNANLESFKSGLAIQTWGNVSGIN